MAKRLVAGTNALLLQSDGDLEIQRLDASAGVYTGADKALISTPPTSGVLGYWERTGTELTTATAGDTLEIGGTVTTGAGRIVNTTRVTAAYTALVTDHMIFADTDGGAYTIDLPAGVEGQYLRIANVGTSGNDVTIDGDGGETVMGAATQDLADGEIMILIYNATEGWW